MKDKKLKNQIRNLSVFKHGKEEDVEVKNYFCSSDTYNS